MIILLCTEYKCNTYQRNIVDCIGRTGDHVCSNNLVYGNTNTNSEAAARTKEISYLTFSNGYIYMFFAKFTFDTIIIIYTLRMWYYLNI